MGLVPSDMQVMSHLCQNSSVNHHSVNMHLDLNMHWKESTHQKYNQEGERVIKITIIANDLERKFYLSTTSCSLYMRLSDVFKT